MSQLHGNGHRPSSEVDKTAPITEQAADWWVLLNSGPTTAEDHRAFGEWVARSPERVEAFLQAARMTKALRSTTLRWPDTPVEELAREVRDAGDVVELRNAPSLHSMHREAAHREAARSASEVALVRERSRKSAWPLAFAASLLGAIAITGWVMNRAPRYETAIGEQRSVVLEDGSVVTLNTASRIDVKLEKSHRTIRLLAGEALFQVAHDPARPFDVIVGDNRVRAVGTQFNVVKRAGDTTVTVVEGKVAVMSGSASSDGPQPAANAQPSASSSSDTTLERASATTNAGNTTYLTAGQQLTLAAVHPVLSAPTPANVATATAWTQRRLVFEHRPLGEVADEFNRYNRQAIRIDSEQLRAQEVTGVFQANDPDSFLAFVSRIPGVRIERDADNTRVSDSP